MLCRAGVGRTGTTIVAANLLAMIEEGSLTNPAIVKKLVLEGRKHRGDHFVQRPAQLRTLLDIAYESPNLEGWNKDSLPVESSDYEVFYKYEIAEGKEYASVEEAPTEKAEPVKFIEVDNNFFAQMLRGGGDTSTEEAKPAEKPPAEEKPDKKKDDDL